MHGSLVPDAELERQALDADPDAELPPDAVSLWTLAPDAGDGALLPDWYMPPPAGGGRRHHTRRQRRVAYLLVTAFALINAAGLCSTYGHVVIA